MQPVLSTPRGLQYIPATTTISPSREIFSAAVPASAPVISQAPPFIPGQTLGMSGRAPFVAQTIENQPDVIISNLNNTVDRIGNRYCNIINIFSDIPLTSADITLEDILAPDLEYKFLRTTLRESDQELQSELQGAVDFYSTKFGIDLSRFRNSNGYYQSGEHRFYPYLRQGPQTAVSLTGNCCGVMNSNCIEGGFVVIIGAPGIVARGSYGENLGENIPAGSIIFYGYYVLVSENNIGRIYHFRSDVPSRSTVDVPLTWNLNVFDYKIRAWGKSIGSSVIDKKEKDNRNRITQRLIPTTSYVLGSTPVSVPSGVTQTNTVTTLRNGEPYPLIVNEVPIARSNNTSIHSSIVNVPTYAPVIKEEAITYLEGNATLISRSIITFGV